MKAIIFLTLIIATNVHAINLEKALKMLEAVQDYETAEPIAFSLTQKKKEAYYYIHFLKQYPYSDFTETVYTQAWVLVKDKANKRLYTSFIKVRPKGEYAYDALDKLFNLYQQENLITGYQGFIKNFPNAPQAISALKAIHLLGFQRAIKNNTVSGYDAYILGFKNSIHSEEAIQKAKSLALSQLDNSLNSKLSLAYWTNKQEQKEMKARKLYNEMRQAEKNNQILLLDRNYFLLKQTLFLNTKVVTEVMDREELLAFRQILIKAQTGIQQKMGQLGQLFKQESQRIQQVIKQEASRTRATIDNGLSSLTASIGELSYEKGRIADAINEQTYSLEQAAREANDENQRLFNQAEENAQTLSSKNRECAEVLSQHGDYPWYSGCP